MNYMLFFATDITFNTCSVHYVLVIILSGFTSIFTLKDKVDVYESLAAYTGTAIKVIQNTTKKAGTTVFFNKFLIFFT